MTVYSSGGGQCGHRADPDHDRRVPGSIAQFPDASDPRLGRPDAVLKQPGQAVRDRSGAPVMARCRPAWIDHGQPVRGIWL